MHIQLKIIHSLYRYMTSIYIYINIEYIYILIILLTKLHFFVNFMELSTSAPSRKAHTLPWVRAVVWSSISLKAKWSAARCSTDFSDWGPDDVPTDRWLTVPTYCFFFKDPLRTQPTFWYRQASSPMYGIFLMACSPDVVINWIYFIPFLMYTIKLVWCRNWGPVCNSQILNICISLLHLPLKKHQM